MKFGYNRPSGRLKLWTDDRVCLSCPINCPGSAGKGDLKVKVSHNLVALCAVGVRGITDARRGLSHLFCCLIRP